MATIKVLLAPGETEDQARASLLKALKLQAEPAKQHTEQFPQPAAQAVAEALEAAHAEMWTDMWAEIEAVIDEDPNEPL